MKELRLQDKMRNLDMSNLLEIKAVISPAMHQISATVDTNVIVPGDTASPIASGIPTSIERSKSISGRGMHSDHEQHSSPMQNIRSHEKSKTQQLSGRAALSSR